jgi:hypothetical protein
MHEKLIEAGTADLARSARTAPITRRREQPRATAVRRLAGTALIGLGRRIATGTPARAGERVAGRRNEGSPSRPARLAGYGRPCPQTTRPACR